MRKNILRVAICAALVLAVGGCGFFGDGGDPPGVSQGLTSEELLETAGKGVDASILLGRVTKGPKITDSFVITCTGCVKELKPNTPRPRPFPGPGPAPVRPVCKPPCTPAQIASEQQDFEQGVAVMRAMLAAHHRGVELEVVLPAPTQPE